jgi:hypothetical protein
MLSGGGWERERHFESLYIVLVGFGGMMDGRLAGLPVGDERDLFTPRGI